MSGTDIGFLIFVIGSFVAFAGTLGFYSWYSNRPRPKDSALERQRAQLLSSAP